TELISARGQWGLVLRERRIIHCNNQQPRVRLLGGGYGKTSIYGAILQDPSKPQLTDKSGNQSHKHRQRHCRGKPRRYGPQPPPPLLGSQASLLYHRRRLGAFGSPLGISVKQRDHWSVEFGRQPGIARRWCDRGHADVRGHFPQKSSEWQLPCEELISENA